MGLSHRIERSSLEVGDHIYAWRIAYTYSHHGIYIGDDTVIHFATHGVISSSVDEFLRFLKVGRYKYSSKCRSVILKPRGTCTTAASDDGDMVVRRAKKLLEHGFGSYDLGTKNCENFAVYCKTGLYVVGGEEGIAGLSAQVASFTCKAVVGTAVGVPLILLTAIAAIAATGADGIVVIAGLAAYAVISGGVVYYCKRRCDKDIGMRNDVMKKEVY